MSKGSDAAVGIALGILGGAAVAYLLSKAVSSKATCPVCNTTVTKGKSEFTSCPKCHTRLRWN